LEELLENCVFKQDSLHEKILALDHILLDLSIRGSNSNDFYDISYSLSIM